MLPLHQGGPRGDEPTGQAARRGTRGTDGDRLPADPSKCANSAPRAHTAHPDGLRYHVARATARRSGTVRAGHGYGTVGYGAVAMVRWLFDIERTNVHKYTPDLIKDPDVTRVSRWFLGLVAASLLLLAVLGGLLAWSWQGAVTAFFWASLVRISLLHHVTWSINSICHAMGKRPFASRDRSGNVWWLAVLSFGESWHNLHHADPTCARHGVLRGQVDISARVIRAFEMLGWAREVRWPKVERLAAKRV